MAHLIITPVSGNDMSPWVSINIYWPGDVEYLHNKKCINLFLNEKRHNTRISYAKALIENFPKLFSKTDFYQEEKIEKASLDIAEGYNIEFK